MTSMLGSTEKAFALNEEEWQRSLLACGAMIVAGVAGVVLGLYRSFVSGDVRWIVILVGFALASFAGYLLLQLRPRLVSIELCERGIRVNERDGTSEFPWDEIRFIEVSTVGRPHLAVQQVFIKRADELGFITNGLGISEFDHFMDLLREIANDRGIEVRAA